MSPTVSPVLPDAPQSRHASRMTLENLRHRAIVAVDMESSTTQTNPVKARLRQAMYNMIDDALRTAGITQQHRDSFIDRGDGILILIHPTEKAPKTRLLDTVAPRLAARLTAYARRHPEEPCRLRAVVHAGEIHYDQDGCFGESLDVAFRLLDAPAVKAQLLQSDKPLALVVSDDIYQSIVRHRYPGIEEQTYRRNVSVRVGGRIHRGWMHNA